jgi:hypothetical protein
MQFTQLMQETWDEAIADMDERQRQLADSWRIAANAAHDGLDAMRDIYPQEAKWQLVATEIDKAGSALRGFEQAWLDAMGLANAAVGNDFYSALYGVAAHGR